MTTPPNRTNVHGTGLLIGDIGVLLRGPSGAGKSLLARSKSSRASRRILLPTTASTFRSSAAG